MTRLQFWRFILDCNLHSYGVTLMEYDRMIGKEKIYRNLIKNFIFLSGMFTNRKSSWTR